MIKPRELMIGTEQEVVLNSVGVDIGSATVHMVFSRLTLVKVGTRYAVAKRELLYESPVMLTPFTGDALDGSELSQFVNAQFVASGLRRKDVDTGALILTGLALLQQNARCIAEVFAEEAGRFVAVSAGDDLEAIMAAFGSGAAAMSRTSNEAVLNIDVGGGTTKLSMCVGGRVVSTAALDVGARLLILDDQGRVSRVEPVVRRIGAELGMRLTPGVKIGLPHRQQIARHLVSPWLRNILESQREPNVHPLLRGDPLDERWVPDSVILSGGVAEYVFERETRDFGDLGPLLANELRKELINSKVTLRDGGGIRATVMGAAQFSVQVSGSTIHVSAPEALPLRNVPVVLPDLPLWDELVNRAAVARAIRQSARSVTQREGDAALAIGVRWKGPPTYARLRALAEGIVDATDEDGISEGPLILVCDDDIGRVLGVHVQAARSDGSVISIDGLSVERFDYIDVGKAIPGSNSVPVVIKSLVFPKMAR